jgi:hypothetical protein
VATEQQIARMRQLVGDTTLTDAQLGLIIDNATNFELAVAEVWQTLAAQYSTVTNLSEAGSSRSLGDLFKNAQAMATYYRGLGTPVVTPPTTGYSRTRAIVRPEA